MPRPPEWTEKARETLELLVRDVPPEYRDRARHHAAEEAENYCRATRIREIGYDQVVIGFIRSTPVHQRMNLRYQLQIKGVPVEKFEQHFFG